MDEVLPDQQTDKTSCYHPTTRDLIKPPVYTAVVIQRKHGSYQARIPGVIASMARQQGKYAQYPFFLVTTSDRAFTDRKVFLASLQRVIDDHCEIFDIGELSSIIRENPSYRVWDHEYRHPRHIKKDRSNMWIGPKVNDPYTPRNPHAQRLTNH